LKGTLIDHCGLRLISFDESRAFFAIFGNDAALDRLCQPRRGNRGQKRDDVGLTVAAGFFQHAAHMGTDGVRRNAAISGDVFDRFAGGKAAGDARLGGRKIEQRLYQFDRGCLRQSDRSQDKRGGAGDKNVASRQANGNDMRVIASAPVSRTGKERTAPPAKSIAAIASRNKLSAVLSFSETRSNARHWT
jgi:hypothetical protein